MSELRVEVWDYKSGNMIIQTSDIASALAKIHIDLDGDTDTLIMGIWHENNIVVRFEGGLLQDMVNGVV